MYTDIYVVVRLFQPAHVAEWSVHFADMCSVTRSSLSGRGSCLSPGASTY